MIEDKFYKRNFTDYDTAFFLSKNLKNDIMSGFMFMSCNSKVKGKVKKTQVSEFDFLKWEEIDMNDHQKIAILFKGR